MKGENGEYSGQHLRERGYREEAEGTRGDKKASHAKKARLFSPEKRRKSLKGKTRTGPRSLSAKVGVPQAGKKPSAGAGERRLALKERERAERHPNETVRGYGDRQGEADDLKTLPAGKRSSCSAKKE